MTDTNLYDFNSTFFLSLATMTFGFIAGAIGIAFKSKCSTSVKLSGCLVIIRDVEIEAEIEDNAVQNQIPRSQSGDFDLPFSQSDVRAEPPTPTNSITPHRKSSRINDQQHVDFVTSMNATF